MSRRGPGEALFALGQFAFAVALTLAATQTRATGSSLRLGLALALGWGSVTLALVAFRQLRHSFRVAPSPRRDGRLERGGIYRKLRHPMYVAVQTMTLALLLWRSSGSLLVLAGLHYLFYWSKARYEERQLMRHYPDYRDYRRQTLGLWP